MSNGAQSSFAALLYDPALVSEEALSRGFAVALAGWDVPRPRLLVAPVAGTPLSVAFYATGITAEDEALEHAVELFEDEVSPAVGVLDAAIEESTKAASATVLTLLYAEDIVHDEAWRVTASGFERRFVREGDDGLERGVETHEGGEVTRLTAEMAVEMLELEEGPALEEALRPHRGSTFLSEILGVPARATLMAALYAADRVVPVRLVEPGEGSIEREARRLNRALGRVDGRGAFVAPASVAGVAQPIAHAAFTRVYDFADPKDPEDLYRDLALGHVVGALRFLRQGELVACDEKPGWAAGAKAGLYPFARLAALSLGGGAGEAWLGLRKDGAGVAIVRGASVSEAGPTFGELLLYLALGWTKRSDAEEDLIGALMLRARVRVSPETRA